MIKRIETISVQGAKTLNEDAFIVNDACQLYGVFDGATSVDGWLSPEGLTGGYLASHIFADHFSVLASVAGVTEEIMAANGKLRKRMLAAGVDLTRKERLWSTCVAIVSATDCTLRYWQLGDAMVIACYTDGGYRLLTRDTVDGISERAARKRMREEAESQAAGRSSMDEPMDTLRYHRTLANTSDGYSVANGTDEVKDFIDVGELALHNVAMVMVITDGLFHPAQNGSRTDWDLTVNKLRHVGLSTYVNDLMQLEQRLGRRMDDKTAIILHF